MKEADPAALRAQSLADKHDKVLASVYRELKEMRDALAATENERARAEAAEKARDCYLAQRDAANEQMRRLMDEHEAARDRAEEAEGLLRDVLPIAERAWHADLSRRSRAGEPDVSDLPGSLRIASDGALLSKVRAFLAGPAAPPPPSAEPLEPRFDHTHAETHQEALREFGHAAEQQETLSGAPAARPGLDRLNAETGEEYGQPTIDSSAAPPMSLEWFRDEYVRRSTVMEAWRGYFGELCDVLFPESVGRGRFIGWKDLIARAKGNAADRPPPALPVEQTMAPDGASLEETGGYVICPKCGDCFFDAAIPIRDTEGSFFALAEAVIANADFALAHLDEYPATYWIKNLRLVASKAWRSITGTAPQAPPAIPSCTPMRCRVGLDFHHCESAGHLSNRSAAASAEKQEGGLCLAEFGGIPACHLPRGHDGSHEGSFSVFVNEGERASPEAPPSAENTSETPE